MNHQPRDEQAAVVQHSAGPPIRQSVIAWGVRVAWGALFLLTFGFCAYPVLKDFLFPSGAKYGSCQMNLKQLATGLLMYAEDYSGRLPPAASWSAAIRTFNNNPEVFHCPIRTRQRFGYAFNSRLSGATIDNIKTPEKVPMLFETSQDRDNAADPVVSFVAPHNGISNVAYADGHVKAVRTAPLAIPTDAGPKQ
jgi:prepilin-type processing-associated H-X9-DG protein